MAMPTLLLTRPVHSAQAFVDMLSMDARDAVNVLVAPLMEIKGTGVKVSLEEITSVVFTSANAVRYAPQGQGRAAFCVGAQTTAQAVAKGWKARQLAETAEGLIEALDGVRPAGPLLHLGGEHTRGDIANRLSQSGIKTTHVAIYDQVLLPFPVKARRALMGPCIIPVFSPRTALHLLDEADDALENAHIIALSEAVAMPLRDENSASLVVLPEPRSRLMVKAVEKLCMGLSLP